MIEKKEQPTIMYISDIEEIRKIMIDTIREHTHVIVAEVLKLKQQRDDIRPMNVKQAAKALGVSESTVRKLKLEGKLPFTSIAGRVMFTQEQLDKYLKKQQVNSKRQSNEL